MSKVDRWTYLGSGIGLVLVGCLMYWGQSLGLI